MRRSKFRASLARAALARCSDGKHTPGKVAIFATCYVNYNEPGMGHDLLAILEHNEIPVRRWSSRRRAAACRSSSSATSRASML